MPPAAPSRSSRPRNRRMPSASGATTIAGEFDRRAPCRLCGFGRNHSGAHCEYRQHHGRHRAHGEGAERSLRRTVRARPRACHRHRLDGGRRAHRTGGGHDVDARVHHPVSGFIGLAVSSLGAACTRSIGRMFIEHFETGATLHDLSANTDLNERSVRSEGEARSPHRSASAKPSPAERQDPPVFR